MPLEPTAADLEWTPPPRPTPRQSARAVGLVWLVAAAALWFWYTQHHLPGFADHPKWTPLRGGLMYLAIALAALGLAMPLGLAVANRQRWRAMLRFTQGKVIAAVLFALFFPYTFFGPLPWPLLYLLFVGIAIPAGDVLMAMAPVVALLLALAVTYLLCAPLIHGIRDRRLRGLALATLWPAAAAFTGLLQGFVMGDMGNTLP